MTRGILGGHQQDVRIVFGLLLEELDKFLMFKKILFSHCVECCSAGLPPLPVILCFSSSLSKDPPLQILSLL